MIKYDDVDRDTLIVIHNIILLTTNAFNYNDFEKKFVEHDDRSSFLNENEKKNDVVVDVETKK